MSKFFGKPPWQNGITALSGTSMRGVPDIAMAASGVHDPYIIYGARPCTSNVYVPVPGLGAGACTTGGTSAATPVFAGILALLNQYLVTNHFQSIPGVGNINPRLYQLAQSSAIRDVVTGSNIVPCQPSKPDCGSSSHLLGYSAHEGYDLATGLGSVDAYFLVTMWPPSLSVALTADHVTGAAPLTVNLTATVSGTATGPINYTLWYNCQNASNSVGTVMSDTSCGSIPTAAAGSCASNSNGQKCNGLAAPSKTIGAVYSSPGAYRPKVIVEQGNATPAEAHLGVTATSSPLTQLPRF